ncbi:pentatricopeptide repeat-containing protein At1g09410, mitochondrial-like [Salvia hispanica]|uniref:pentatricopeptide repeat-containing protein At1g09410, mitochondrial-like n=1 Tax=Salvia hispanica TaxID=49212 RepID=UPI0020098E24|nr:pentatricopeptide repeat-containing protein At1g09410, mitochondrial-like [Salvia hispanica]
MRTQKSLAPLFFSAARFHTHTLSTVTLNHKINNCVRSGNVSDARKLFDDYPHSRNTVSWNSLINGYIKSRHFQEAQKLFDEMPHRDVVSWNTLLSGFRDAQSPDKALRHFLRMMASDRRPVELTFAVLMSAFLNSEFDVMVPQLHGLVTRLGLDLNIYLGSALMRGYVGLADRDGFRRVFDEIEVVDVVPCNVLILGYIEFGMMSEAKTAFDLMPKRNAFSWSIIINGLMKNKMVDEAKEVFDSLLEKDVVSWTAMIRGCAQGEKFTEALDMFPAMMSSGVRPNHYTFSSVFDACAGCSSLVMGSQAHACLLKLGIPVDVVLGSSLLNMYAKCGDIVAAFSVFESMPVKNLVSWNSIIGGCGRHGLADRALEEFERMTLSGVLPDQISFINVLSACVHGGKVREAEEIFYSIQAKYGLEAEMEHYSCMVDLYGRAGELEKAEELVKRMPFEPDVVVWGALLGACGLHSCLEVGEFAAMGISKVEKDHPAVYSILSKIYGANGTRSGVFQLKKMIRKWQEKKQKAGSWIQSNPGLVT